MYASAQEEDQEAMKTFAKLVDSVQMSRDKIKVPVYFIYKFLEDILNGDVSKRLLKDMQTSHSKTILKTLLSKFAWVPAKHRPHGEITTYFEDLGDVLGTLEPIKHF